MPRAFRTVMPYVLSFGGPALIYGLHFATNGVTNYQNVMSATINLGAIGVGFLAASITLLPSIGNNSFINKLKEIGAYKKLLQDLIHAIVVLFVLSLFSVVGVFIGVAPPPKGTSIDPTTWYLIMIWAYLFSLVVIQCSLVIKLFVKALFISIDDDD